MPAMRREFALVLLLGAAGAGVVVLAARQTWAQAIFTPPRPLPAQDISVTGQQLVPLAGALALAAAGCTDRRTGCLPPAAHRRHPAAWSREHDKPLARTGTLPLPRLLDLP